VPIFADAHDQHPDENVTHLPLTLSHSNLTT